MTNLVANQVVNLEVFHLVHLIRILLDSRQVIQLKYRLLGLLANLLHYLEGIMHLKLISN